MKTIKKQLQQVLLSGILLLVFDGSSYAQCGGDVDFSTDWAQTGPSASGDWTVSGGGSTVTQTVNGNPTFYVSGDTYIDIRINGTFQVNTGGDDDFIGFVFGYESPNTSTTKQDFYLFDWKQGAQTFDGYFADEGFSLTKVDSTMDISTDVSGSDVWKYYWGHTDEPGFDVMETDLGAGKGWNDFTEYDFTLTYTSKKIIIEIDSDTIFNVDGCFEPGKFGFYNFSQSNTIYSDFSYELIADFDMSVTEACVGETVDFNAINDACLTASYESPIAEWSWDLGDGTIVVDTNTTHIYTEAGTYTVTLSVEDELACVSSVDQTIEVKGLVAVQEDTLICEGDSTLLHCNPADDGAMYQWFKDGTAITSPTVNDTTFYASGDGDYHVEMSSYNPDYDPCNTVSNTVTVSVEDELILLSTPDGTVVCSGAPVNIVATDLSGALEYEWFKGGTSDELGSSVYSASSGDDYYVAVTSANGCVFLSDTVTLTEETDPSPVVSASPADICPGETSTLSVSLGAGETVEWYLDGSLIAGETGATYDVTVGGDYTVVVTNSSGCSGTSPVETVTENPVPDAEITASDENFCPDVTMITLDASPGGAVGYEWLMDGSVISGETDEMIDVTISGSYEVIVTNASGCSDTSEVTELLEGTVSDFELTATPLEFCEGEESTISTTSEAGSMYLWYQDETALIGGLDLNSINSGTEGDYFVEVTNDMGCTTYSDTVHISEIDVPDLTLTTEDDTICDGEDVTLTAGDASVTTYEWYHDGSLIPSASGETSILSEGEGTYYVSYTTAEGCEVISNEVDIYLLQLPDDTGPISGPNLFCEGETVDFTVGDVTNATEYTWTYTPETAGSIFSGQGTTSIAFNTMNNNFTVTVTPENECGTGGSSDKSVTLDDEWACPNVKFAANETNVCQGSEVTFYDYTDPSFFPFAEAEWDFGDGASPATATGPGPHVVTYSTSGLKTVTLQYVDDFDFVVDEEVKTEYINVNGEVSTSEISGEAAVPCDASAEVYSVVNTAGSTYDWTVPTGASITSGAGTNEITVDFAGNFGTVSVVETTASGCIGAAKTIDVSCDQSGIKQYDRPDVIAYPNPANDHIYFKGFEGELSVSIYDLNGQVILKTEGVNETSAIDISMLKPGVYIVRLRLNGKISSHRMTKL